MFAVHVDFLTGRCVAARVDDRDEPEWPPHPARLFFALVNAWAEGGKDQKEEAALHWLEEQLPPAICAAECDPRPVATVYVPPNDVSNAVLVLPERRKRQPRTFPSVTPHDSQVWFVWRDADPAPEVRRSLDDLSRRTCYLGHSSSLVSVRLVDNHPAPAFVPVGTGGNVTFRVPAIGQLEALEHAFDVFVESGIRGQLPCANQMYGFPATVIAPLASSFFDEMIVFQRADKSPHLPIEAASRVATLFRAATMSAAGGDAPEVITGHQPGGGKSERLHLAFAALPDVGHRRADGHLLGVAAVLPRALPDGERALVYRALLNVTHLTLGRLGRWDLVRVGVDPSSYGLRTETWTGEGGASLWATVTPIELDSFPDEPFGAEAQSIVARACARIGLPTPTDVAVGPDSVFRGVPPWHAFARRRAKSDRPRRPLVHTVIRFPEPVRGPVLLGAGRYLGLGLLRPFGQGAR